MHSFPTLLCLEKKPCPPFRFFFFFCDSEVKESVLQDVNSELPYLLLFFYFVVETSIALGVAKYSSFELSNLFAVVS